MNKHYKIEHGLLYYSLDPTIEAFSTTRGASLPYYVVQSHQIHSDGIAIVTDITMKRSQLEGIDALITNVRGCAIGVRTADCVPILLYDSVHNVVAAVHSGWKGTVRKIVAKVIHIMHHEFNCNPSDMKAIIGPSISVQFFQVGDEVVDLFETAGFCKDEIVRKYGERNENEITTGLHIDLWKANSFLLRGAGIKPENIAVSGICTYSDNRFPSARREHNNKCERIINVIKIL